MIQKLDFWLAKDVWQAAFLADERRWPFLGYDWHKVWYETLGKDVTPLPLLADGGVVPLCVVDGVVRFSGGEETSDYLDVVGAVSSRKQVWESVVDYLRQNGHKRLELTNVPEGLTVDHFSQNEALVLQEDTTPLLHLLTTWDDYLVSLPRKWRKELKRKMKNFERDYEGVYVEKEGSIDCLIRLMKLNDDKVEFFKRPGYEEYFRLIYQAHKDSARIRCLSVSGDLAASIYYFETDSGYLLYNSGFDKSKYDGAGLYLKALNIKSAIESGKKIYNFLQGNERYKYELGGKDFWVYRITLGL